LVTVIFLRLALSIKGFNNAPIAENCPYLGWIFLNENRQRLLNKLTKTLVIKVKPVPSGVKLVKEEE
jgi:hypothetical protein